MTPPSKSGNVVRRYRILALASAVAAVGVIGCGGAQDSADSAAQDKVNETQTAITQHQLSAAQTASDAAGQTAGMSAAMQFRTHMLQGQVRVANSQELLRQARDMEMNVSRLLGQVRVAAGQVQLVQGQIKSDQAYDPAETIEKLKAKIAEAQGGEGATEWAPPKLPQYKTPAIVAIAEPAKPVAAAAAGGKPSTGGGGGMAGFFKGFLGGGKPAATPTPPAASAPATGAEQPAAPPAEVAEIPARPLDILVLKSLAGLDGEITRLQAEIAANRDQAAALNKERTGLLSQSDDQQQKSLGETGQASVDDVAGAAELRRKASDLAAQTDIKDAAMVHLKADLDKAQVQRQGVAAAIDGFNKQIADLEQTWKTVQQDIDSQKQAIAAMAGPETGAAPAAAPADNGLPMPPARAATIADQCTQLKAMVVGVRDLRDRGADELKDAIKDFNLAATAGEEVRKDASAHITERTPPGEKTAWQQLQEAYSAGEARMGAANAERELAVDYSSEAMIARQVKWSLGAAATALGADAPAAVADCLTATASPTMDEYADKAEERFKDALDHFDSLTSQTMPGPAATVRKTSAMVGKMIAAFGARQLSLAMNSKPVAGGQSPADLQKIIDDLASSVSEADPGMLPAIPYTISATPAPQ